jgi:hypothetical protein
MFPCLQICSHCNHLHYIQTGYVIYYTVGLFSSVPLIAEPLRQKRWTLLLSCQPAEIQTASKPTDLQAKHVKIKCTTIAADVVNALHCSTHILGTSIKSLHLHIKVLQFFSGIMWLQFMHYCCLKLFQFQEFCGSSW